MWSFNKKKVVGAKFNKKKGIRCKVVESFDAQ